MMRQWKFALAVALVSAVGASGAHSAELEIRTGDHICLVGNGLGERMQFANAWETLLYQRFPDKQLVVRNLCVPGDEPFHRERSLNFGTPDDHLRHSKADVILFFFGMNEAFAGPAGLESFRDDLIRLVEQTRAQDYSGKGPPRMAFVSPIAHEDLHNPHITDGRQHNEYLAQYTAQMEAVARAMDVGFVDLFHPTLTRFADAESPWTINGVHLSDEGYHRLAPILDHGLFGSGPLPEDLKPVPLRSDLKAAIADKNFHWWHRYRAVNGYSIWGTRGEAGFDGTYRNRDVMERERAILDQMCANRDQRIWAIAQGKSVPDHVDDSNTLPFIVPKTNVGGVDDPNRKAGKLGSLEYIPAAEQLKYFKLPPGYVIELVASEEDFPELANPVALNFDSRGRLWVATMPSYPQWQPKTVLDDKLLILTDENGDGRADKCRVFAGGLHQPTGFELGKNGVFVAQQPDVLFLQDTDGDDQADIRVRRLIGFDTADSHHGLAAFEWGPDGALYFQEGTFKQSQVETPYGLVRMGDAGVWRYEPQTEKFSAYVSFAFANPWGHVFDAWGQNFLADASPGFNYWAAPLTGFVPHPDKHPGGARDGHLDWGGSKSKKSYPVFIPKRIRPSSGCEFVSSRNFPPEVQGNFLVNNVIGDLGILQHTVREEGSGFAGEETTPLLLCEHGNFRPVDLQFGPDGALYIVDWHNALIGHLQHNLRDPNRDHSHGRIWRVYYKDRPLLVPPTIAGAPVAQLLELLREPEDRTRYRVRRELAARDTHEVMAEVAAWVERIADDDPLRERLLLEALWLHQAHDEVDEDLLRRMLSSPDHRARAAAVRVLVAWRDRIPDVMTWLAYAIRDAHPRVRLEAVRGCSFIHTVESLELALDALDAPTDVYLDYTIDETVRVLSDLLTPATPSPVEATDSAEHHGHAHGPSMPKPLVFLDKSPASVAYQLRRLSAAQLLLVDRAADDPRTRPVFAEILTRAGISRQDREQALSALVQLDSTSDVDVLLDALHQVLARPASEERDEVVADLSQLLLAQPAEALRRREPTLRRTIRSPNGALRAVGYAALIASGQGEPAWEDASKSPNGRVDFLRAIPLLPDAGARNSLREIALAGLAEREPTAVRLAALDAVASLTDAPSEYLHFVASLVAEPELRAAAVRAMQRLGVAHISAADARAVLDTLLAYARRTPAARRTTPDFLDAMNLADQLLVKLSTEQARSIREQLRSIAVRVVRIQTVHEEMRYDTPYFAVEAGRPVQIVLRNEDLMPHNLVITAPGKMRDVALLAATLPPTAGKKGLVYVPESSDVLFAMPAVEPHRQAVLTFTAPKEPGEYPFVCTFPNHWMRMYGVMVVTPDLDAWLANPVKPADPLGSTREFVRSWKPEDFRQDLTGELQGRSPEIGERLFREATCVLCHKMNGTGGAVGPDLTEVLVRWKDDYAGVLRELLDPSHKVDPQYALYNIVTEDGRVISGVITAQSADTVTVVSNAEQPEPLVIRRDEIDSMSKAPTSLMPKGLMDRFTRDEILELLAYITSGKRAAPADAAEGDHATPK